MAAIVDFCVAQHHHLLGGFCYFHARGFGGYWQFIHGYWPVVCADAVGFLVEEKIKKRRNSRGSIGAFGGGTGHVSVVAK